MEWASRSVQNYITIPFYETFEKLQKVPLPPSDYTIEEDLSLESLKNRIEDLEKQNSDLRNQELNSWCRYSPLSKTICPVEFPEDDIGCILEGVIYLSDLLVGEESKENINSNAGIEKFQRNVIRALNNGIKKIMKPTDSLSNLLEYKPSDKDDRQL